MSDARARLLAKAAAAKKAAGVPSPAVVQEKSASLSLESSYLPPTPAARAPSYTPEDVRVSDPVEESKYAEPRPVTMYHHLAVPGFRLNAQMKVLSPDDDTLYSGKDRLRTRGRAGVRGSSDEADAAMQRIHDLTRNMDGLGLDAEKGDDPTDPVAFFDAFEDHLQRVIDGTDTPHTTRLIHADTNLRWSHKGLGAYLDTHPRREAQLDATFQKAFESSQDDDYEGTTAHESDSEEEDGVSFLSAN